MASSSFGVHLGSMPRNRLSQVSPLGPSKGGESTKTKSLEAKSVPLSIPGSTNEVRLTFASCFGILSLVVVGSTTSGLKKVDCFSS